MFCHVEIEPTTLNAVGTGKLLRNVGIVACLNCKEGFFLCI